MERTDHTLGTTGLVHEAYLKLVDQTRIQYRDRGHFLGQVVECRFFGGLSEQETAEVVGVTTRTVRRDWTKAKGWLREQLSA